MIYKTEAHAIHSDLDSDVFTSLVAGPHLIRGI